MDEYVIGSVANIISKNKLLEVKSKKQKHKSGNISSLKSSFSNEMVVEKKTNLIKTALTNTEKKKNKHLKNSFKALSFGNNFSATMNFDTVTLKPENENQFSKIESPVLKIQKAVRKTSSNVIDCEDLHKQKKMEIDLLPLDHIPSDSEEENDVNSKADSEEHIKSKKTTVYTDFKENTVFVGNIPINYDKQKICRVFSKFGEIQNARIRCVPIADINMSKRVAAIKKKFSPKRNSLVAYVKFKSQDSATAALKANGMVIDGHHLRVDFAEENKNKDSNKAIFVGGLPFDIEDDELWELFEHCGKINSVRIVRDSQTSMGKGFGYVNFNSTASVELALRLDGQEVKKRIINVKRYKKARNKNKLNSFGRKKSNELTNQLLCKKAKKFKEEREKLKKERKEVSSGFQGRTASIKKKKKKKLSEAALRKKKLVKILTAS